MSNGQNGQSTESRKSPSREHGAEKIGVQFPPKSSIEEKPFTVINFKNEVVELKEVNRPEDIVSSSEDLDGGDVMQTVHTRENSAAIASEVLNASELNRAQDLLDESAVSLLAHGTRSKARYLFGSQHNNRVFAVPLTLFTFLVGACLIWWLSSHVLEGNERNIVVPDIRFGDVTTVTPSSTGAPTPTITVFINLKGFACTYGTRSGNVCISLARGICVRIGEHGGIRPSSVRVRETASFELDVCADFRCFEES